MGFAVSGRLELRLDPSDVGKRVSVRSTLPQEQGAVSYTDAVGVLTSWQDGVVQITRRSGEIVHIAESRLVAGKVVPPAPARTRGPVAPFRELATVTARAWQPVETGELGEWQLRAAGGFTRRANSVLPLGDPGVPLDEALTRVVDWYAERSLPAYVQTAVGAEGTQEALAAQLLERGWASEVRAHVLTGSLAVVGDLDVPDSATAQVRLSRTADDDWLARYHRAAGPAGATERAVLASGPSVWFASVLADGGGAPAAIGRLVVDGRWAGFLAVEVDPERRRQGLARAMMARLARQALDEGASAAWLQVETDNEPALTLYAGMGFGTHHTYQHHRAPGGER